MGRATGELLSRCFVSAASLAPLEGHISASLMTPGLQVPMPAPPAGNTQRYTSPTPQQISHRKLVYKEPTQYFPGDHIVQAVASGTRSNMHLALKHAKPCAILTAPSLFLRLL